MSTTPMPLATLTAKDLASDQEVRWCPGCGDYSILAQMKKALAAVGVPREKTVIISGIGCSSRFPYYMNTYGFHSIHGRAPTFATGPEATFVARTIDTDINHQTEILKRAAAHKGTAFVEIYQNCKIFNDGVFEYATDKAIKADNTLHLEHGKPLIFGKDRNKGVRLNGLDPEAVTLGSGINVDDLVIHDERAEEPTMAYLLSRMVHPKFPECVGIFRAVERDTYDQLVNKQIEDVQKTKGAGKLEDLFASDDVWVVE